MSLLRTTRYSQLFYPGGVAYCLVGLFMLLFISSKGEAQEIAKFRTTDTNGRIELRYLFDERIDKSAGVQTLNQKQATYEEEFFILTHNYVYHPNFLKLDLGGGVTLVQDMFSSTSGSRDSNDILYNLQARASFLEKKPYPFTLFFTRDNPASFPGLAERVQQTNTNYGANLSLLEPFIPLKVDMFASHQQREGSGATQIVDDSTDRFGIRASKAFSKNYSVQAGYDYEEDVSASGSRLLPITATSRTTETLTYSSQLLFGTQKQLHYFDNASYSQQDGPVTSEELRFSPSLLWKHSDSLRSSYNYHFLTRSQDFIDTTSHSGAARLDWLYSDRITANGGVRFEDIQTTGQNRQSMGVNGAVSYKRPIPYGTLALSAGLGYDQLDRESTASQLSVIGESITLSGTTPVELANDFIITATIVVQNLARTQTYIEGVDYAITVIGTRTEIERVSGTSIGDPEQVLVDYSYQSGGTVAYTSLTQNYQAMLSIFEYYNLYARYNETTQDISSGSPTTPLNSQQTISYGAGVEYPVNNWMEIGGNVGFETHDEDVSPSDQESFDAYMQFVLPYSSNLRVAARQVSVDNHNSPEDVNLTSYSVVLRSRPLPRMTLTAEARSEEDTGGTSFRSADSLRFNAQWRIYRLILNAQATFTAEQTGISESERTLFYIFLRREI